MSKRHEPALLRFLAGSSDSIWVYWYSPSDDGGLEKMREVAEKNPDVDIILIPRRCSDPAMDGYGIERIEKNDADIEQLKEIFADLDYGDPTFLPSMP
jgi:hypothetical protein